MPFPDALTPWIPVPFEPVFDKYLEHNAWLSDDVGALARVYSEVIPDGNALHVHDQALYKGGLRGYLGGAFARGWYGRRVNTGMTGKTTLHAPLAGEVASLSADSLYARRPTFRILGMDENSRPTREQSRLDEMMNSDAMHLRLHEAGELTSALGGCFWKVDYDRAYDRSVQVVPVDADAGLPEFEGRRLTAVTFWTGHTVGDKVYRHMERHEVGAIRHRVYLGSVDNIGTPIPIALALTLIDGLEFLARGGDAATVDEFEVSLATGIRRLTAVYQPNSLKNHQFRRYPHLAWVGKSDYAGLEPFFQAFDQTWSSWLRDISVGRARIFIPDGLLDVNGIGRGASFDDDRDVFRQIDSIGAMDTKMVEAQQFEIRSMQHEATLNALAKQIMRRAGHGVSYLDGGGREITATEVGSNGKREESARDRRMRYAKSGQTEIASVAMEMDALVFPGQGGAAGLRVVEEFPPDQQVDLERDSRIIGMLNTAGAISLALKVKRANPDFTPAEIQTEVAAIREELEATRAREAFQDPAAFTGEAPEDPEDPDEDSMDPREERAGRRAVERV